MTDIEGLAELKSKLKALESKIPDVMEKAATDGALVGERYTKEGSPVKTGKLRRSYATRTESKSSDEVMIRTGTDVDYAPPQEFGTSRMSGKPHLRPGFLNHKTEIVKAVSNKIKELIA